MWNFILDTFGPPDTVSFGKLRTTRLAGMCGVALAFGLCGLDHLSAQGPGLGAPTDDSSPNDRGGGGRRGRGGRGGFDPAQMIGRLDENQDGVVTSNEVENAPGFARRMLQDSGLDFNRGVRVEDLQQSAQQRMDEMRRQRDGERSDRTENVERPDRPDWAPPQSMGRGDFSGQATPADQRGSSATSATASTGNSQPRTRVSPLLPDSFQSYDMDQDGQIALSEWRKGKRGPLSQFMQYDLDGDGFLIAKELMKANAVAAAPSAAPGTPSPASPPATATTNVANPTTPAPPAASPTSMAPVTVSAADALKATGAFNLLDKDKNGTVAGEEWSVSRRLKPLFEKAGYDLAKPMNKDEFTQGYVRVGGAK